jgi:hypothetical protein
MSAHHPEFGIDDAATEAPVAPDAPFARTAGEDWMPADQVIWITLAMLAAALAAALT